MTVLCFLRDQIGGFDGAIVDILSRQLSTQDRLKIAQNLKNWLTTVARVKPVVDLQVRIDRMTKRFEKLAEVATFNSVENEVVVKAVGESEVTLKMLENGTEWFDPCESVVNVMISALWKL